ncbi:MAG: reverse transcriptase family protein [Myxococcota bacterium]
MSRRQELYDRLRAEGRQKVILDEMIRHGFWEEGRPASTLTREERDRLFEVARQVKQLSDLAEVLEDPEKAKAELRKRRMAEARAKRAETKRKREEARQARARAWAARKRNEILWVGPGVSRGLGQQKGEVPPELPDLQGARRLAHAFDISVGELRWLAYHRPVSATTHYRRFQLPKKTGGTRLISAPRPRLKRVQRWILDHILSVVPVHDAAHGFVAGRSIVTNAAAHVGRAVVLNLDLRNFFPTLSYPRVYGLFASLGYSREASTLLSLLCTEPEVDEVELDGRTWYVHASERHLPQGSPCSPALTNLICRRLDRRLHGLAESLGFAYTRYADDLSFSHPSGDANVGRLLKAVRDIVADEDFVVHPDKTRVMRRGRRQEVTGLIVNDRLGVPRDVLRQWRATLFQVRRDGPEGKRFGLGDDVLSALVGFAAFVRMVDEPRGDRMLTEAREVARTHGWSPPRRPAPEAEAGPTEDAPVRWWEFWKWFR